MTVRTHDGRILHHNSCTYCIHRKFTPRPEKLRKGRKIHYNELCGMTGEPLVNPFAGEGVRYCKKYQQVGCECELCRTITHQTDDTLDKMVVL